MSQPRSDKLGIEVERLIKGSMAFIVNKYIRRYKKSVQNIFGWTPEDLMQEIRFTMYKGLVTFDKSKGFKVETYLSSMLYYQFGNLSKSCRAARNKNSVLFLVESIYPSQEPVDENDGHTWVEYAQKFSILMEDLTEDQKKILWIHLVEGASLDDMVKLTGMRRSEVVAVIKDIQVLMKEYME